MSACLLLCTSCAAPDPFEAFSPEAPNDKARYFRKDLMKALYVNPPWGAPHSMPLPPCHADNFRPKEIIRCYSLSPDYLHEIMKVFEVTPSKLIKEEKKTTYVYDLSSKKCPLVIVREEEMGEKSWIEQIMDTFQLKSWAPVSTRFLFYKDAPGDCSELQSLLGYLEQSRSFKEDHPEAKQCKRPKNAAAEECQVECRYRTKAQVKNAISVEDAYADWAAFHRRQREENLAKDPLYEFTIQDKNGRTLKCGRPSPYYPVKCDE
ncbi:hypothetical protein [Turicimonas muris]|nr:hypothetical protein [Turicimonas muris]QQQ96531.1 hypothetical protein I5Q81_11410 [Turicimonas muris]